MERPVIRTPTSVTHLYGRTLANEGFMLNQHEYKMIISDAMEAEIVTEFGDGTKFKEGQQVVHNLLSGTFRCLLEDECDT